MTQISEGEEYDVSFDSGGNMLVLKVILSSDFPQDKPTLKIIPPVIHAWINSDGEVISAPGLLNVRSNFQFIILNLINKIPFSLQYIPILEELFKL